MLCLISSLKDAAIFLRDNEELFIQKVREVVVMGGVLPPEDGKPLLPDTAHNNQFDIAAAEFLYSRLQHLGIPTVTTTRHCAYAAQVPRGIYDRLALTGSPIGVHLRQKQRASIEGLWLRAVSVGDARAGLPVRSCNLLVIFMCGQSRTERVFLHPFPLTVAKDQTVAHLWLHRNCA